MHDDEENEETHISSTESLVLLHGIIMLQLLLVLAALVLEPHTDDLWTQSGNLHQVLLHESVRARVVGVNCTQSLQLLLRQDGADTWTLVRVRALGGGPGGGPAH